MSRWGNTLSRQEELNLANLMVQKKNGVQLLKTENFQPEAKNQNSKFTQLIIEPKNRHFLYDLIDIAINPAEFMRRTNTLLDKTLTHSAIETLTSLTEEFMEYVFENKGSKDDEVIQNEEEYAILHYILRVLTEKDAQQTGLAYLVKLISPFIYQKPEEMIKIVSGNNLKYFLQYFHSKSVCQLLTKFLEVDSQSNFFQEQKIALVHKVCEYVKQEIHNNKYESVIQSFAEFIVYLAEKHEDQYDRSKYAGFLNKIVGESQYFVFLLSEIGRFDNNRAIKTQFLHCIKAYLRIHLPIKKDARKSEETQTNGQKLQISEPFYSSLISYLQQHSVATFDSYIRQQLLNYYEIVKAVLILQPSSATKLINAVFLQQTFSAMQKDPENNILHNNQKDVILASLAFPIQIGKILQSETQLLVLLQKYLKTENSNVSFQNQLFLIGEAFRPQIQTELKSGWKAIDQTLQDKRKFYLTQIGGNPRKKKDKWSDFQDQIFDKAVQNKTQKITKESNGVRVFKNTGEAQSDPFGLQGAEVLSNQIDENQRAPRNEDFFTNDIPFYPSFSMTMSGQFFNGDSLEEKYQKSIFFSKCESIYINPAREEIQTVLKSRYNLKLSGNR